MKSRLAEPLLLAMVFLGVLWFLVFGWRYLPPRAPSLPRPPRARFHISEKSIDRAGDGAYLTRFKIVPRRPGDRLTLGEDFQVLPAPPDARWEAQLEGGGTLVVSDPRPRCYKLAGKNDVELDGDQPCEQWFEPPGGAVQLPPRLWQK